MRATRSIAVLLTVLLTGLAVPAAAQDTGTIAGTVTDWETGEPIADICVGIAEPDGSPGWVDETTTGPDGDYEITAHAGHHRIVFWDCIDGRQPGEPGARWQTTRWIVDVWAGETTQFDTSLAPGGEGQIRGIVTDAETGEPVEGICISAFDDDWRWGGAGTSDEDGEYLLEFTAVGEWRLEAHDCLGEGLYRSQWYDGADHDGDATPVEVVDGEVVEANFAMVLGGAIRGVVVAQHTGAGTLVCVEARPEGAGPNETVFSDRFGAAPDEWFGGFILAGMEPGTYRLTYNTCDWAHDDGLAQVWYPGAESEAGSTLVTVELGEVTTADRVELPAVTNMAMACPADFVRPAGFTDVPSGNVHAAAIDCMATHEIAAGRGDGTYDPSGTVRRGQMAAFIARTLDAAGVELPANPPSAFNDTSGHTFELQINQLAALGIVQGVGGGRYNPNGPVNRAAMSSFLVRTYEEGTEYQLRPLHAAFADIGGNTHEQNIKAAATAGIVRGTAATTYSPNELVRRDQMASFLARLLDRTLRDNAEPFSIFFD